jgi:hypothetical protein
MSITSSIRGTCQEHVSATDRRHYHATELLPPTRGAFEYRIDGEHEEWERSASERDLAALKDRL